MTKLTIKNRILLGISDSQLPFLSLWYHYLCLLVVVFLTQMCDICKGGVLLTLRVSKINPIFNLINFLFLLRQGIWYCLFTFGDVNIAITEQPVFLAKKNTEVFHSLTLKPAITFCLYLVHFMQQTFNEYLFKNVYFHYRHDRILSDFSFCDNETKN